MASVITASRLLGASLLLLSRGHPAAGSEQHRLRSSLRGTRRAPLDAGPEPVKTAAEVVCDGNDQVFKLDLRPRDEDCEVAWVLERDHGRGGETSYAPVADHETSSARAAGGMCLRRGTYRLAILDACDDDALDGPGGSYDATLDGEEIAKDEFGFPVIFEVSPGSFPGKVPFAGKKPASSRPALASATASKLDALSPEDGALVLAVYTDPEHETVYPDESTEPIVQIDDSQDAGDDPSDDIQASTSTSPADTEEPSTELAESRPTGASMDQDLEDQDLEDDDLMDQQALEALDAQLDLQASQTWASALDGRRKRVRRRNAARRRRGGGARRRRGGVRP